MMARNILVGIPIDSPRRSGVPAFPLPDDHVVQKTNTQGTQGTTKEASFKHTHTHTMFDPRAPNQDSSG